MTFQLEEGSRIPSTNGNFLCKCKFPLPTENLCAVFRAFPTSAGSQWPLAQNIPYAKEAYFKVAYCGTLHGVPFLLNLIPLKRLCLSDFICSMTSFVTLEGLSICIVLPGCVRDCKNARPRVSCADNKFPSCPFQLCKWKERRSLERGEWAAGVSCQFHEGHWVCTDCQVLGIVPKLPQCYHTLATASIPQTRISGSFCGVEPDSSGVSDAPWVCVHWAPQEVTFLCSASLSVSSDQS